MSQLLQAKQPRQARSLATMHRILDATESLLEDAAFETISLQSIMRHAAVCTGSFYARFQDKLSLLGVLYERYASDIEAIVNEELPGLEGLGARERIIAVIRLVGRTYSTRCGVARSAALHYWNSPEGSPLPGRLAPRQADLMKRLRGVFDAAAEELSGQDTRQSAAFALKTVLMCSREHYLFAHKVKTLRISDEEFELRLSEMVIGYLQAETR